MKTTPKPKFKKCPKCKGIGATYRDIGRLTGCMSVCDKCNGTGKVEVKPTKLYTTDSKHALGLSELSKPTKEKKIEKIEIPKIYSNPVLFSVIPATTQDIITLSKKINELVDAYNNR